MTVRPRAVPDEDGCPGRPGTGARIAGLAVDPTALTDMAKLIYRADFGGPATAATATAATAATAGLATVVATVVAAGGRPAVGIHVVDRHQRLADLESLPGRAVRRDDRAGERGRDFDQGLRRLHLDKRLVDGDGVTGGDEPLDDLCVGEPFAEVG
jgi:hypothetical protein